MIFQCDQNQSTGELNVINDVRNPANVHSDHSHSISNGKKITSNIAIKTIRHPNFSKNLHTAMLYTVMLGMGSMHTVVGPTFLDLAYNLRASVKQISTIYVTQGVGFAVGTIAGGLLIDRVPKTLFMVAVTTATAVVTASIPHWPKLWMLSICFLFRGATIRSLEIGCNVALLELWGIDSSRPMQALHFFLAVGCALGPLLVQPFLGKEIEEKPFSNITNATSINHTLTEDHAKHENDDTVIVNDLQSSKIELAYLVIGFYLLSIAIITLIAYCIWPPPLNPTKLVENKSDERKLSKAEQREKKIFHIKFISIGTIVLFLYFGSILSFDSFLPTFCVTSKLRMSQSRGANLSLAFWSSFVLARFLASIYAGKISDLTIIWVDVIGIMISSTPLSLFVEMNEMIIWVCVVVYGVFMASLGPAAISYTNNFINISGKVAAIYMMGAAVGETAAPVVIGQLFELTPMVLMYTVTGISFALFPLTAIEVYLAHKKGKRRSALKQSVEERKKKKKYTEVEHLANGIDT